MHIHIYTYIYSRTPRSNYAKYTFYFRITHTAQETLLIHSTFKIYHQTKHINRIHTHIPNTAFCNLYGK